jgi:hypothetical protein
VDFAPDGDGLLSSAPRAQLMVLRSLAAQYGAGALRVTVHLRDPASPTPDQASALANALLDLDAPQIHFVHDGKTADSIQLFTAGGQMLKEWNGFQNAAALGAAVRAYLGPPRYAAMGDEP